MLRLAVVAAVLAWVPRAAANNAGAVVLVNSQSAQYPDFAHYLQPYLANFGVPYTVLDIASNSIGASLTNYALIIIGHKQLDTNAVYLNAPAQNAIMSAVSNGTGLVSFDNVLAGASNAPLYQFAQGIFGFAYTNPVTGPSVVFPPTEPGPSMHFTTSLHGANSILTLSNATVPTSLTVTGLLLPSNATAVATCGGSPLMVVCKYGQGRAVQWASYDWISVNVLGPVNGLDDLVWRGMVWAARKPFVMRGFPNFVTLRVDDVAGPFNWIHDATNAGFKPFLALFTDSITAGDQVFPKDGRMADLRSLTASGIVTASMHSFSSDTNSFFYFNHAPEAQWPDGTVTSNYARAALWHQTNGIPISKVIVAHFEEIGTNAFNGLTNWGVEYTLLNAVPGTVEYIGPGAPWMPGAPYRLYEAPQLARSTLPATYADFVTVPNHPELDHKFFNCYTEIRNAGINSDWYPLDTDVPGTISRGYNTIKRSFDSMVLATLVTHEWFIENGIATPLISSNNWQAMLAGVNSNIASYHPVYVTLDYACQYRRAAFTSQLQSADLDPVTGRLGVTLSGSIDLPIAVNVYTGADGGITNTPGNVPVFSGTTNALMSYFSVPAQLLGPTLRSNTAMFTLVGQYGKSYAIEASGDFKTWTPVQTAVLSNCPAVINVPPPGVTQYYRARLLP